MSKTEAIKEEKITYLVDTGFYTREEAEAYVQNLAGEDEKPKVTQKTEEAFKKYYKGKSSPGKLKKLASDLKDLRTEYTGGIREYKKMETEFGRREDTLEKLKSEEAEMQKEWDIYESGEVEGYSFWKPDSPKTAYLNVGTWGKYLRAASNLFPEGHILNKEGSLYQNLMKNRDKQRMLEEVTYGDRPYPVFGSRGVGAVDPYGLENRMSSLKSKSESVLFSLAEMETEYRKINKGQYLEGIEELDPRVKTEADELLKGFISTISE